MKANSILMNYPSSVTTHIYQKNRSVHDYNTRNMNELHPVTAQYIETKIFDLCLYMLYLRQYYFISILTFFSKIFEKLMYCNIFNFLEENRLIFNRQFGFRQKYSTSHAIITLIHKITNSLDHGDIVISIFLDLKKAFDTVDHRILLNKLYAYGIRGNVHDWFRSYLTDRSQFVIYDRERSDTKQIKCGVPQGSILGPILFIIYMNDIMNVSNILYTILYADDTCAVLSGNDLPDLMKLLHTELCKLSIWLSSNKLSLNTNKTFYLLFHRARIKPVKISMKMNGSIINKLFFGRIGIMMYKYSKGLLPEVIGEMYRQNNAIHSHRTRSRDLLRVPQGTIHFVNVSARLWNVLVLKMDVHIALSKFKYNLKVFLLHNEVELKYSK